MFKIIIGNQIETDNANICTQFYIKTENIIFPDEDWSDLSAAIIAIWCRNISSFKVSKVVTLYFLDGEYSMVCEKEDKNIHINMVYDHAVSNNCICIPFDVFILEILKSARKILRIAENTKFRDNSDVITIRKEIINLKSLLK